MDVLAVVLLLATVVLIGAMLVIAGRAILKRKKLNPKRMGLLFGATLLCLFGFIIAVPKDATEATPADANVAADSGSVVGAEIETVEKGAGELRDSEKTDEVACRGDLKCWSEKNSQAAFVKCSTAIENRAKFDFKWTSGWTEPRFPKIGWSDPEKGVLYYFGDAIQLQNGLGNWIRHSYGCEYDPATKSVVSVAMEPGRWKD